MKIKHKNHMTLLDVEKSNKIHDHFIMTALKKLGIDKTYIGIKGYLQPTFYKVEKA